MYGLPNIPGVITSHFPNLFEMAANHHPKRVLWICDAVTNILLVKDKQLHNCSSTYTARNNGNAFDMLHNLRKDYVKRKVNFTKWI